MPQRRPRAWARHGSAQRTGRVQAALAAGATHVAVGTTLCSDPGAPARIAAELQAELARHGLASAEAASGIAQASVPG